MKKFTKNYEFLIFIDKYIIKKYILLSLNFGTLNFNKI